MFRVVYNDYSDTVQVEREVIKVLYVASTISYIAILVTDFAPEWIIYSHTKTARCIRHHFSALVCSIVVLIRVD